MASGSSTAVTTLDQPSQRGSTPWRSAATANPAVSRIAARAPHTKSRKPAFSNSRRVFGSSSNSPSIAENAVARESASPARINTDAAKPPANATRAADETDGPARSTTTRTQ